MMTLGQANALLPGSRVVGDRQLRVTRVHTDSRSVQPGDLFVALRGERFDGHEFLAQAHAAGAAAALAEHGLAQAGLPGLEVDDSLHALQQLAGAWRRHLHLPLIAVTGSNGKTTVTQMAGAILRAWHPDGALVTQGNLNNHIGLPLTLLRLRQDDSTWHCAAAVEIGMNHPGEVAGLARLAAPTVAVVNNAQREHQEFMDGVEAVARENGCVIEALAASGTAVFPADDAFTPLWRELAGRRDVLSFALGDATVRADVQGSATWQEGRWAVRMRTPAGEASLALRIAGRHHVCNALAATAAALAAGAPLASVVRGLEAFEPVAGRSRTIATRWRGRPVTLVDDSYNANPDSVRAAVDVLAALPAPHWLLLGDMAEVGTHGPAFHAEVGAYARERGIETLWCAGESSAATAAAFGAAARHFADVETLLQALADAPAAPSVLVKGSRSMRMERVVKALQEASAPPAAPGHAPRDGGTA